MVNIDRIDPINSVNTGKTSKRVDVRIYRYRQQSEYPRIYATTRRYALSLEQGQRKDENESNLCLGQS